MVVFKYNKYEEYYLWNKEDFIEQAEWHAKVEKYFALLHPDFDTLSDEQQWDLLGDKHFIIENTDAIHEAFSEFSNSDSPRYMKSGSEQEKIQKAIEEIKVKERNSKKITPTAAVKSALKGSTAIKSAEANGVEQSELNPEIDLSEQNISPEANAIIVNLFRDYFATEEQKAKIKEILDLNQKKEEQEKREKYNPDDIFKKANKNKEITNIETSKNNTNTALIEYKESFFARFKNFIFKILHISK